ncbi:MAG: HAMP domain-containing protein, partial [candidate division Zixibacteria bacterium]|nr:HAMP domain-containing protein [candidate division Zixibacteria bacterium]
KQSGDIVNQVADNMGLVDASSLEQQKMIDNAMVRHGQFHEISVLDSVGRELFTTRLGGALRSEPRADIERPQNDTPSVSPVFISGDGLPVVSITTAIKRLNQVTGYVTASVNLKDMWDLVDSVRLGAGPSDGGGYAYVVSDKGRLIAHPDRERVYRQEDLSLSPIGASLLERKTGTLVYHGKYGEVFAAFAPIDPPGWSVVIEQPVDAAFARSREMKWEISLLIAVSALTAAAIGMFVARKIARPIVGLVRGVQLFGQGTLTHTIDVPANGELKMLAQEFNNMALKLSEKERQLQRAERLATLSKFASILSHEIRNPLNAMVINMQLLKREMEKQSGQTGKPHRSFERVMSEIRRIDGLVEHFLTYARPPALTLFEHNINNIVAEVVDIHRAAALERSIRIETYFETPRILVRIDADRIKQVFLNLMLNAFDAMEQGGTLVIRTRLQEIESTGSLQETLTARRPYATVVFHDTGCGIFPEHISRIFEVYYTSKSTGTGLGLPIAQQIVEKHGGKIDATSTLGQGSTFTVWLPAFVAPVTGKRTKERNTPLVTP